MDRKITVCYFGMFNPAFSRNEVYIRGLRDNGVGVIVCNDTKGGIGKFFRLFMKHWKIRNDYDVMIVGYAGHTIMPFAKLIAKRPVIFDALCSFYEAQVLSRDAHKKLPFRTQIFHAIDWWANACADFILVETEAQKHYYEDTLGVQRGKCIRVFTGVPDNDFYYDPNITKYERFTVLFRGRIVPEAGVIHIIKAAELLKDEDIQFEIIGIGWGAAISEVKKTVDVAQLSNLKAIFEILPIDQLRERMLKCHVSLGQFADHPRLARTIPHKAFEALAMKLPYITSETMPIKELMDDRQTCLFTDIASPADIAEKILLLKNNEELRCHIAEAGFVHYREHLTPKKIMASLLGELQQKKLFPDKN